MRRYMTLSHVHSRRTNGRLVFWASEEPMLRPKVARLTLLGGGGVVVVTGKLYNP